MKLADGQITTESSMEMDGYAMGIDAENMSHIIDMLINQYTNLELAVIREYAANALDAHRMAGTKRPIRVTLPTAFSPNLVVEDWGIGMSREQIQKIYAQYGASTKRDTNSQIGGFGIGAKSAFAVSDQFIVSAVKDGILQTVIFNRTAQGGGVKELPAQETDQPNGVKVTIPVKGDYEKFEIEAKNLFRYWLPTEVEVVGCEINHLLADSDQIDNLTLYTKPAETAGSSPYYSHNSHYRYNSGGTIHVRMGGIAYELTTENQRFILGDNECNLAYKLRNAKTNLVIDVEIGSVNLAPSREALVMDQVAQKNLRPVLIEAEKKIGAHYGKSIEAAKSMTDAVKAYLSADAIIKTFCDEPTWRGKDLPLTPSIDYLGVTTSYRGAIKIDDDDNTVNWSYNSGQNVVIIAVDTAGADFTDLDGFGSESAYALHHSRRGPIRRVAKPFTEALDGNKVKGQVKDYTMQGNSLVLVTAADAKRDPYIKALGYATMTLEAYQDFAAQHRAKRLAAGDRTAWKVRYQDERGADRSVEDLTEYDAVYVRNADDGLDHHANVMALGYLRTEQMVDNSVIIQLNRRQSREVFDRRMKDAEITVTSMESWYKDAVEKAVADLTEAEVQYLDLKSQRAVYDRVIRPWAEKGFAGLMDCTAQHEDMTTLHTNIASLTGDQIRRVDTIMAIAGGRGVTARKPVVTIASITARTPLLPIVTQGLGYGKLDDILPALAATIHEAEGWMQAATLPMPKAA